MGTSSRILVAPGIRSAARPGWRAGIATAAEIVSRDPRLWLYGALGFSLRGGIAALTLPIIVLPTQVEARAMLGANLGSSGFTDGFWWLVAFAAIGAVGLVIAIAVALARLELASFERVAGPLPTAGNRRVALRQLITVQLLAVAALALAAVPLAMAVGEVAYDEVLRPTSTASIYGRVLARVGQPIVVLVIGIVAIELFSALASREVLVRAGRPGHGGRSDTLRSIGAALVRPFRTPVRTFATAAFGWALTLGAVLGSAWLIGLAWQSVRVRFLTSVAFGNLGADIAADLGLFLIATGLATAFVAGVFAAGLAAAVRGAAWSVERLS